MGPVADGTASAPQPRGWRAPVVGGLRRGWASSWVGHVWVGHVVGGQLARDLQLRGRGWRRRV